jgi:hypothetical protein
MILATIPSGTTRHDIRHILQYLSHLRRPDRHGAGVVWRFVPEIKRLVLEEMDVIFGSEGTA